MLVKLCKGTHISALKDAQGKLTSSAKNISLILEQFYAKLFGQDPTDLTLAQQFLNGVSLPKNRYFTLLSQLNTPLTDHVVSKAISILANGKAPGLDSYTPGFFQFRNPSGFHPSGEGG